MKGQVTHVGGDYVRVDVLTSSFPGARRLTFGELVEVSPLPEPVDVEAFDLALAKAAAAALQDILDLVVDVPFIQQAGPCWDACMAIQARALEVVSPRPRPVETPEPNPEKPLDEGFLRLWFEGSRWTTDILNGNASHAPAHAADVIAREGLKVALDAIPVAAHPLTKAWVRVGGTSIPVALVVEALEAVVMADRAHWVVRMVPA